jgi:hypothetical protein
LNGCCDKFRAGKTDTIEGEALLPTDEAMHKGDVARELNTIVRKADGLSLHANTGLINI